MKWRLFLFVLFSAFLIIFVFPPYGFYQLSFIFLIPYFIFLFKEDNIIRLFTGSFLFKIISWLCLTYFILEPLIYLWLAMIFLILPLAVIVFKKFITRNHLLLVIMISFGYAIVDYLAVKYSLIPAFIVYVGNSLGDSPFLGLAKYGGLLGLGFFITLINGVFAFIYLEYFNSRHRLIYKDKKSVVIFFCLVFLVVSGFFVSRMTLRKAAEEYFSKQRFFNVAIISVARDFDREFYHSPSVLSLAQLNLAKRIMTKKFNVLEEHLQGKDFDIIVFPEALFDSEIYNNADAKALTDFNISNNGILIAEFSNLANRLKTPVMANLITVRDEKRYNTALVFNRNGEIEGLYDKNILAFGGEYWPFGNWRPFYYNSYRSRLPKNLPVFNQKYNYTPGSTDKIFELSNGARFGVLICLESHIPDRIKSLDRAGADFFVNSSSNNWIKLGLENYLALSMNLRRIMAVSAGKPLIISGRQDYAGVILPDGTIEVVDF
ncbi:apolipoprotein N-acyltransferase, partial [Candidatus Wolfebacteria bacterium]|nr:apolipoprotein N-acyltransferase [Candidatus Wolfebacteria bacterium]